MKINIHTSEPGEAPRSLAQEQAFQRSGDSKPLPERLQKRAARREARRKVLWQRHYQASSVAEIESLLDELDRLESLMRPGVDREDIARLRPTSLQRLLEIAGEDVQVLERVLAKRVIPVCCRPERDRPTQASLAADVDYYWLRREPAVAREVLEQWLERIPFQVAAKVRGGAISHTLRVLRDAEEQAPFENAEGVSEQSRQARAALLTLGDIGFRSIEVEDTLLACARRPGAIGTAALSTLISLGVPLKHRAYVSRVLRRHLVRHSHLIAHVVGLGYSLQEFASPSLFGEALEVFDKAVAQSLREVRAQRETPKGDDDELPSQRIFHAQDENWAASTLQRLMERYPDEARWHERFWQAMWAAHLELSSLLGKPNSTFLNGGHMAACNVFGLARDVLLRLIPSYGDDPGDERHAGSSFFRSLALETLDKCVGEEQLRGLSLAAIAPEKGLEDLLWLERDAMRSTGVRHTPFGNSLSSHKRQTWRLILQLEILPPDGWLDALRDEADAHTIGRIYEILACLSLEHLPQQVWDAVEETYDNPSKGPYDQFVLRMGAQRLVSSSASHDAFAALLECSFTHGGELMMATLEHLSAVARHRHSLGDASVVPTLLKRAQDASSIKHRELALGSLRALALSRQLSPSSKRALLRCARDKEMPAYARALAVESLGFLRFSAKEANSVARDLEALFEFHSPERFPPRRSKGEHEIGWNAAESLVRLGQWRRVRASLLERLGINALGQDEAAEPSRATLLRWRDVVRVDSRGAFLAALILLDASRSHDDDEEGWQVLVCDVVGRGASGAAFAVLRLLLYGEPGFVLPQPLRQPLVEVLRERISRGHTPSQSETYVFAAWVKLAPDIFIEEQWEQRWNGWLPDSRVALADAIEQWAVQQFAQGKEQRNGVPQSAAREDVGRKRAVHLAGLLTGDGLFAVRRAAYRTLVSLGARELWLRCLGWTFSDDAQLRRRAAEATAWLPDSDSMPPSDLRAFLFEGEPPADGLPEGSVALIQAWLSQDAERTVRQASELAQEERRRRLLADKYLGIVQAAVESAQEAARQEDRASHNRAVLHGYRYGRALAHVGSDDHLRSVRELLNGTVVPSLRSWLDKVREGLESQWKNTTQQWPDPWLQWQGVVEELEGHIQIKDEWHPASFTLRRLPGETPHQYETWEGTVAVRDPDSGSLSWELWDSGEFNIKIPGRNPASAHVVRAGTHTATLIRGDGFYPSPLAEGSVPEA